MAGSVPFTDWVSILPAFVTWLAVTQNLPFLLTVAGIHFAYLWMDGQAELAWVAS